MIQKDMMNIVNRQGCRSSLHIHAWTSYIHQNKERKKQWHGIYKYLLKILPWWNNYGYQKNLYVIETVGALSNLGSKMLIK